MNDGGGGEREKFPKVSRTPRCIPLADHYAQHTHTPTTFMLKQSGKDPCVKFQQERGDVRGGCGRDGGFLAG